MLTPLEVGRLFFGEFELDTERRALCRHAIDLHLAPKEYQVLACLVRRAGKAVSRETLLAEVWPDTSLARCISSLRKHLGSEAIQAVPKFGYRFTLPVTTESANETDVPTASGDDLATVAHPDECVEGDLPPTCEPPVRQEPRAWRGWATFAAVALALSAVAARGPLTAGFFQSSPETWTDPQTGLMWQKEDNGVHSRRGAADVTREAAAKYCSALVLSGQHDWRLPTIEELQTLHDPTQSTPGLWGGYRTVYWHIKGGITLSGGEVAADSTFLTDVTPAGEEQSYDFSFGRRNYDPVDFKADHRVLCVRKADNRRVLATRSFSFPF
jgi:DNA-binding winged helix-turn-helix (wHTH) protein